MVLPTKFTEQIHQLDASLDQMGQDCLRGLSLCKHSLVEKDKTLAFQIKEIHEQVLYTGHDCEHICLKLLLLQHPIAKDLRRVTVAMNAIRDFNRVMDHEKEIADLILALNPDDITINKSLERQFQIAKEMISGALQAFEDRDDALANMIIQSDDCADSEYAKTKEYFVEMLAKENEDPETLVDLLIIGKYLERMCDHCENIARWVLYQRTGIYEPQE